MELHEKLALLRKEKGLTQTELAGEMDITRQAVSRWETGLSIPTTENLTHLSRFYQVPVEYLLNEDAERPLEEKPTRKREKPRGLRISENGSGGPPRSARRSYWSCFSWGCTLATP